FWDVVREGVGIDNKNDPRLLLRNALMTCKIGEKGRNARKASGIASKQVTSEEVYRWAIRSWNAWRRDEPLAVLRAVLNADRPKVN
ncbi:MAG: hypothetical protein AAB527_03035, partial [Patescibacteria group bacterium]